MTRTLLTLALLLGTASHSAAQIPVTDGGNLAQNVITAANAVLTAANTAKIYVLQGEQLINEFNLIRDQIVQIEHMVTNLQRIPEGLNYVDTILAYGNKLTGLMSQANAISYELDSATKQFQTLYADADTLASGDLALVRQRFLNARMQASGVAVQVQSVQTNVSDVFARLCSLLDGSWRAKGNLDSHQLAAQQQALQLTTLQHIQALQATAYRLQAQREAEEAALERLRMKVMEQFTAPIPEYTGAAGFLPTYQWTDTR